jgi:hypothetical protein
MDDPTGKGKCKCKSPSMEEQLCLTFVNVKLNIRVIFNAWGYRAMEKKWGNIWSPQDPDDEGKGKGKGNDNERDGGFGIFARESDSDL